MQLNEEQIKIVESNAKRIIVSASAGSGKTTVMIERIIALIRKGVSLSQMMISTFTKASAADMREKLGRALMTEQGARFIHEAELLPTAAINNLHSICQRIVATYFYAADVDPCFEVVDDNESWTILSIAMDEVIAHWKEIGDDDFDRLYYILYDNRSDRKLRKLIFDVYEFAMRQSDAAQWLSHAMQYDESDINGILEAQRNERREELRANIDELLLLHEQAGFVRNYDALKSLYGLLDGNGEYITPRGRVEPAFTELNDMLKKLVAEVKKFLIGASEVLPSQRLCDSYRKVIIGLTTDLKDSYERQKRTLGKLDFGDLEQYTLKILQSPEARGELQDKYKYVFVDEYQDINPLQERIISAIGEKANLFFVGDVKQSIYAFRGCDPSIFMEKYESYRCTGEGEVYDLNCNFRSSKEILNFVNSVFEPIMTREMGGVDYKGTSILRSGMGKSVAQVECVTVCGEAEQQAIGGIYSVRESVGKRECVGEVAVAVGKVLEMLDGQIDGKSTRFCDIAILTRSMDEYIDKLERQLDAIGIPVERVCEAQLIDEKAVRELLDYLMLIDNGRDDIALVSGLRGHFGGFDDSELATIAAADDERGKDGNFYRSAIKYMQGNDLLADKLRNFYDRLERWRDVAKRERVSDFLGQLVAESGYESKVAAMGERDSKILEAFLEQTTSFGNGSLYSFITYVTTRNPCVKLVGSGNAVHIMTIHASKGLEFPCVIMVNTSKRFNFSDMKRNYILSSKYGLAMKIPMENEGEFCKTDLFAAIEWLEKHKQTEEEMRLTYVALTRARDKLAILAHRNSSVSEVKQMSSPYSLMMHAMTEEKYISYERAVIKDDTDGNTTTKRPDDKLTSAIKRYIDLPIECRRATEKTYVSKIAKQREEEENIVYVLDAGAESAIERGNAYHHALQAIDFNLPVSLQRNLFDTTLVDESKLVRAVEIMKGLASGYSVYKEKDFIFQTNADQLDLNGYGSVLVQGIIDLLLVKGDRAVVIDYKTGSRNERETGYRRQVNLYAAAVENILGLKVERKLLYYIDSGELVEVEETN